MIMMFANSDGTGEVSDSASSLLRLAFQIMHSEWLRDGESSGLMALKQTELWVGSTSHLAIYERHPDFEILDPSTLPCPADHAVRFTSLTITPAVYLDRLVARFLTLGGKLHRAHVPTLSALFEPSLLAFYLSPPRAVFVCVGLGARDLGGVDDKFVYPTRGQVVAVRAPWIRAGTTRQVGSLDGGEGGTRSYVIPRVTGEVILGGTREENDWEAYEREATAEDILKRAIEICPDIVPPNARHHDREMEGLESIVISHLVGFRPSRDGGTRLEREDRMIGDRTVPIIYNYGHGGAGWQSSWGTAEDAVELLANPRRPKL